MANEGSVVFFAVECHQESMSEALPKHFMALFVFPPAKQTNNFQASGVLAN